MIIDATLNNISTILSDNSTNRILQIIIFVVA